MDTDLLMVRRLDGLTYRFAREAQPFGGRASYRRTDVPVRIRWIGSGWATVDEAGAANGWPIPADAAGPGGEPPRGPWRSRKGARSYLYDLIGSADGAGGADGADGAGR